MTTNGSCLCGAVQFTGTPLSEGVRVCHCKMCRVQNSGPFLNTNFADGVTLIEQRGLKWFDASDTSERGFCAECGSTLFWRAKNCTPGDWSVSAGTLPDDALNGICEHVWIDDSAPYYEFTDSAPRKTASEQLAGRPAPKPHGGQA